MKTTFYFLFLAILILFVAMLLFGCGESPLSSEKQTPDFNSVYFKIEINSVTYEAEEILYENQKLKINIGDLYWVEYQLNEIEYYRIY